MGAPVRGSGVQGYAWCSNNHTMTAAWIRMIPTSTDRGNMVLATSFATALASADCLTLTGVNATTEAARSAGPAAASVGPAALLGTWAGWAVAAALPAGSGATAAALTTGSAA